MAQTCPNCKRTISDEETQCPNCGIKLSSETSCPFCKLTIDSEEPICPHCGKLLMYEYPKRVTAKRNAVLIPLGALLLLSMAGYWYLNLQGIIEAGSLLSMGFLVLWLIGFALY